jgi:hypothetical protein
MRPVRRLLGTRPGAIVGAVGILVGLAGIAVAAIPDSGGVIHGCYHKHGGELRVVDSAKDCRRSEKSIAWNQKGPAGPPGQAGKGIVARPTGSSPVVSKQYPELVDFPLSANTWTRQPGELDEVFAEATLQVPLQCYKATSPPPQPGDPVALGAVVKLFVNGQELPADSSNVGGSHFAGETYTAQLYYNQSALFPSFPTGPTTVTAKVYDSCDNEHVTWKRLAVTVVGAR